MNGQDVGAEFDFESGSLGSPMTDLAHPKLVAAIVAAIVAVIAVWVLVAISRWRRITWRNHMDTQLGAMSGEARDSGPWAVWKVFTPHEDIAQPSLVLLRIRNSGFRNIRRADMRAPLTFTFPGRAVKEFTVTDCRKVSRQEIQPHGGSLAETDAAIALPRFALKRRAGFKLLVLLSGAGRGVVVDGWLEHGSVLPESPLRSAVTRNIAFASVLLLLIGVQAGITFSQSPALPAYCASGRLLLEGSTAFAPTARSISQEYMSACPGASISVSANATFNGLNAVAAVSKPAPSARSAGAAGSAGSAGSPGAATEEMAMSDGQVPAGYPTLLGHPVAVIIFAVVVNRKAGIYNLTKAQLRGIFLGAITNWNQLGGPDLPVRIVARTTASGTRRTFDQKVLGQPEPPFSSYNCVTSNAVPASRVVKCEVYDTTTLLEKVNSIAGAIGYAQITDAATYPNVAVTKINGWDPTIGAVKSGAYPYWAVEYLYTSGSPAPRSLEAGFLGYLDGITADDILRGDDYTPCVDRGQTLMSTLCRS
jgi:ABC-type phosphate transport system substrate-binding protein